MRSSLCRGEKTDGVVVHTVLDIDPDEPANMSVDLAIEWTQAAPQSFRLNDSAPQNMESMLLTRDTSQCAMSPLNELAERNISGMLVTRDTSHLERSLFNDVAQWNIADISLTFDTSHLELSLIHI